MADDVEHDQRPAVLSTRTRGVGLFAVAVPNGYWTTTLSRDGNYRIHYVSDAASDRAAEPEYVALLRDELEDARRRMVDNGYREPKDTFGGKSPGAGRSASPVRPPRPYIGGVRSLCCLLGPHDPSRCRGTAEGAMGLLDAHTGR
jgi:hypothetical protein